MKSLRLCVLCAFALVFFQGCASDGSSAVQSLGATIGYNSNSGDITAGITITFKDPPSRETVNAMLDSGAMRVTDTVFLMPPNDRNKSKAK